MIAYNGWKKQRTKYFSAQQGPDFDFESKKHAGYAGAVARVLASRILSGYRGNATNAFWGGQEVQKFEAELERMFNAKHAIACNSATSGLWMACAAIGLKPGDEVIVTPWSMSCSATVPLLFGAIPVFADIHPRFYSLDPADVERRITPNTKAIIAVDLFGLPHMRELDAIAQKHGLYIIEDAAQAIGAQRDGQYAGTLGDIGVFSFTQGKHMTAGEGGACVTNNPDLAKKLAMVRNHAEAVTNDADKCGSDFSDSSLVGLNLRMTEIQAAIMCVELEQLEERIAKRQKIANEILDVICGHCELNLYPCDLVPDEGYTHALYCLPIQFGEEFETRSIADALKAELVGDSVRLDRGVPLANGYIDPLYKMPLFKAKRHWAFKLAENLKLGQNYSDLHLPNVEALQENGFINTLLHSLDLTQQEIDDVTAAFAKVVVAIPRRDII